MNDHHYNERDERITGARFESAASKLFDFVRQQRGVPPAERYHGLPKLQDLLDSLDWPPDELHAGRDSITIGEEASILGAPGRWREQQKARIAAEESEADARSEILRGLRDL